MYFLLYLRAHKIVVYVINLTILQLKSMELAPWVSVCWVMFPALNYVRNAL